MTAPTSIEEKLNEADRCAGGGNFQRAHELLNEAEAASPNEQRVHRSRGAIYFAQGQQAQARRSFEQALAMNPRDARSVTGLGMCEMGSNNVEGALRRFAEALTIEPKQLIALRNLIECSYALNRYTELERALRSYLVFNPQDLEIQFCLAGCLYKQEQYADAEEICETIRISNSNHPGMLELRRLIAEKRAAANGGQTEKLTIGSHQIEKITTPTVTLAPQRETPRPEIIGGPMDSVDNTLIDLDDQRRRGNFAEVVAGCDQILKRPNLKASQLEHTELLRAEAMMLQGSVDEAGQIIEQVLRRNPQSARALCGKGAMTAFKGKWDEAKALFTRALEIDPKNDTALTGIGLYNMNKGDKNSAWEYFEHASHINPENTRALLGIIEVGYATKRLDGVEKALKAYLDMHPADMEFLYSLAGCLYAQNRLSEAKAEIDKITLFKPDHRDAIELRGMIEARNNTSAALESSISR